MSRIGWFQYQGLSQPVSVAPPLPAWTPIAPDSTARPRRNAAVFALALAFVPTIAPAPGLAPASLVALQVPRRIQYQSLAAPVFVPPAVSVASWTPVAPEPVRRRPQQTGAFTSGLTMPVSVPVPAVAGPMSGDVTDLWFRYAVQYQVQAAPLVPPPPVPGPDAWSPLAPLPVRPAPLRPAPALAYVPPPPVPVVALAPANLTALRFPRRIQYQSHSEPVLVPLPPIAGPTWANVSDLWFRHAVQYQRQVAPLVPLVIEPPRPPPSRFIHAADPHPDALLGSATFALTAMAPPPPPEPQPPMQGASALTELDFRFRYRVQYQALAQPVRVIPNPPPPAPDSFAPHTVALRYPRRVQFQTRAAPVFVPPPPPWGWMPLTQLPGRPPSRWPQLAQTFTMPPRLLPSAVVWSDFGAPWLYDSTHWDPTYAFAPEVYARVVTGAPLHLLVRLTEDTIPLPVTEFSVTAATFTLVRGAAFVPVHGREYRIQFGHDPTVTAQAYGAWIVAYVPP